MAADNGEVRATAVIAEEAAADTLVLPVVASIKEDEALGVMGGPFDRRTPFFIGLTGGLGVLIVTLGFVLAIAGFILIAVPPISHEVQNLVNGVGPR